MNRSTINEHLRNVSTAESRLRLQTIVRLRWLAVFGQVLAIAVVYFWLGFDLPVGPSLVLIALSAWLNIFLSIRFPASFRLSAGFATLLLAYDVLQLAGLLYLTGGIENPFTMLIVAPVTVSAATLPVRSTLFLGTMALCLTLGLVFYAMPLPWDGTAEPQHPLLFKVGSFAAVGACMCFLAIYVWRITKESNQMSAALAATELVLAREQKLHALDGLAAAAAHELGTPLSTIVLATKELERDMRSGEAQWDDIVLVRDQAQRCREILEKLTRRSPEEQDPLHSAVSVRELLAEAMAPHEEGRIRVTVSAEPFSEATDDARREPVGVRRPGVMFGLSNIIENAMDFARTGVLLQANWDRDHVVVRVIDDGHGFRPEVIDSIGEPYVTTRPAGSKKRDGKKTSGLGLGFFIAKTLLERSGARLSFENRKLPATGAIVRIEWTRSEFEAGPAAANAAVRVGTRVALAHAG